jgi:hypothetical protein
VDRTPLLEHPVRIEAAVLDELALTHGAEAARLVLKELRKQRCHDHPAECELAAKTLLVRQTDAPLRLFRHLLNLAIAGDLLIEGKLEEKRRDDAENAARAAYAYDPDDPSTHWEWPTDARELEVHVEDPAEALVRKRLALERAVRAWLEWIRRCRKPAPTSAAASRFLSMLKPDVREDLCRE